MPHGTVDGTLVTVAAVSVASVHNAQQWLHHSCGHHRDTQWATASTHTLPHGMADGALVSAAAASVASVHNDQL